MPFGRRLFEYWSGSQNPPVFSVAIHATTTARSRDARPGSQGETSCAPLSSFQPRVLLPDHALVQLLEEWRLLAQRLPWWQLALRPGAGSAAVIVGQRPVGAQPAVAGLFLVLDHVLRAKELPVVAQVLVELLCPVRGTGVWCRMGARIVFRLATTRRMTALDRPFCPEPSSCAPSTT